YNNNTGQLKDYDYTLDGNKTYVDYYYYTYGNLKGLYDKTVIQTSGKTITKNYEYDANDSLLRLNQVITSLGSLSINQLITYDDSKVVHGNASLRVKNISYSIDGLQYEYTYDNIGNITNIKVYKNGNVKEEYNYKYDNLNQLVREDVKNNNIYSYCSISNCYTKYYYYDTHGNITDIKKFNYGESEYQYVIPDFYEYSSSNPQVKMRYNGGYDYRKIYNLQIGETPNLYFNFYIYDSYQVYMPSYLIESNLNVNKVGYYYNTYYATDGYLNVTFRIVFKVGNPESTPNNYPIEHLQYIYNTQWKDRLDSIQSITYDSNGNITSITPINTFTYDQIGNPTKIYNFKYNGVIYAYADLDYEGRVLRKIDIKQNDGKTIYTISYKYNDQGLRTEKTIFTHSTQTTVTCKYFLDGDKVLRETINSGSTTKYVDYLYDVDGTLIGFKYNNNIYLYIRNLQGDITKIVNESGNVVVEYVYDAWGNIVYQTSSELAKINPYRYRGYRYDEETGWYYLQSRYYNPEIGRFINADDSSILSATQGEILSHNLYAYCGNNPVMMVDPSGFAPKWWQTVLVATAVIVVAAAVATLVVVSCGATAAPSA
ncbi:MAG TPA: RHS repeat-associated core domain-containing protein, partial [Haloplasmataceae bacterium]